MTRALLPDLVADDWAVALGPQTERVAAIGDHLRREIAQGRTYLPDGRQILRAFERPLADVRVLIVGQDPYPTPGHPIGLCFAVDAGVRPLPRSLVNIYQELHTDLGLTPPEHGDLTAWADQGVLLLNRVLTVRPARRDRTGGSGGRRSRRRRSTRWWPAADRWWPSCGAATPSPCMAGSATYRPSRAHTRRRCRHRGGSSGRDRSAGRMPCSRPWAHLRSTGPCPVRHDGCDMWYWVFKYLTLGPAIRLLGRPRIEGRDRLPRTGPAILASNHQAIADSLFLPLMVPRKVLFVTKLDAFSSGGVWGAITRWICTVAGQIPIDRSNSRAARAALDTSERLLGEGNVLGIYPEGTRSPDGRVYKGKTGVVRIAAAAAGSVEARGATAATLAAILSVAGCGSSSMEGRKPPSSARAV